MSKMMSPGKNHLRSRLLVVALVLAAVSAFRGDPLGQALNPFRKVVLVGASATAGFKDPGQANGPPVQCYGLSWYLEAALLGSNEPVTNVANALFFFAPRRIGPAQIEKALKVEPSLVIGLDFLFWYCYGEAAAEEERIQRLEQGLKELGRLKCALIVGDIPDASAAANRMLLPSQIPQRGTLELLNKRVYEWAAEATNVTVLELSRIVKAAVEEVPVSINGLKLETGGLMQADRLHPTPRGAAVMALAILDAVQRKVGTHKSVILWDVDGVYRKGITKAKAAAHASSEAATGRMPEKPLKP